MPLSTNIDLQTILANLGRAYNTETSGSSIVSTIAMSTGPQYSVSLSRNLISTYTNGSTPIPGGDYDILNKFGSDLRTLEIETNNIYQSLRAAFLAAEYSRLNTFINNSYGTNIRSYLNSNSFNSLTGPVYDVHGGFAQSYLDYNGQSLIFKVAEIICSGSYITMFHGASQYPGIGGYTRSIPASFNGPTVSLVDENIGPSQFSGPYGTVFECGGTGSTYFGYILGSSGSYRTLAYPRVFNAGSSSNTGSSIHVGIKGINFSIQQQPVFRNPGINNVYLLKAKNVIDNGDRDFVFKMVDANVEHASISDTEQTQTITVAGVDDLTTIVSTTGNTSFSRPFSLVSAIGLQDGEVFEIWVAQ